MFETLPTAASLQYQNALRQRSRCRLASWRRVVYVGAVVVVTLAALVGYVALRYRIDDDFSFGDMCILYLVGAAGFLFGSLPWIVCPEPDDLRAEIEWLNETIVAKRKEMQSKRAQLAVELDV